MTAHAAYLAYSARSAYRAVEEAWGLENPLAVPFDKNTAHGLMLTTDRTSRIPAAHHHHTERQTLAGISDMVIWSMLEQRGMRQQNMMRRGRCNSKYEMLKTCTESSCLLPGELCAARSQRAGVEEVEVVGGQRCFLSPRRTFFESAWAHPQLARLGNLVAKRLEEAHGLELHEFRSAMELVPPRMTSFASAGMCTEVQLLP